MYPHIQYWREKKGGRFFKVEDQVRSAVSSGPQLFQVFSLPPFQIFHVFLDLQFSYLHFQAGIGNQPRLFLEVAFPREMMDI